MLVVKCFGVWWRHLWVLVVVVAVALGVFGRGVQTSNSNKGLLMIFLEGNFCIKNFDKGLT